MVGILEVQGIVRHAGDAAPAEFELLAVGDAGKEAVRLDAGGGHVARDHRDLARRRRAVAERERQRVAILRSRDTARVQEFGALEEDVEVPAAVVVRPARELAQLRKQLVGGNAVERRHPRTDDVLLVRCRARNDERVREPEVA